MKKSQETRQFIDVGISRADLDAPIATIARLTLTFDHDGCQASCPFNQLKLARGGIPRDTTVHLQRAGLFPTLIRDDSGAEDMQTKARSAPRGFSLAECVVGWTIFPIFLSRAVHISFNMFEIGARTKID